MERLILFAVAAIIWSVVKALSQPAPKRPAPRQAAPRPQDIEPTTQSSMHRPRETQVKNSKPPEMALKVEELEDTEQDDLQITSEDFVRGVIMAEVLGPPRARSPRRLARR